MNTIASPSRATLAKVPAVTLGFWLVKIAATTLGETAGDTLSMSLGLGYLASSVLCAALFLTAVHMQMRARTFRPARYWLTIIASTTLGTTLADFADRSLGIGYAGGSAVLVALLVAVLVAWRMTLGTVAVNSVATPAAERFYWATIIASTTLGTALGDWTADDAGLGYLGSAAVFGAPLLVLGWLGTRTQVSRAALFWSAFVITRPLGAVLGDFLDKPLHQGGLGFDRFGASAVLLGLVAAGLWLRPQSAAPAAH